MSLRTSLYSFLSGNGTITAVTSAIYPQRAPQQNQADPFIVFTIENDEDQQILDGVSGTRDGRFIVDCYSARYLTADQLATAVKSALIGHRGTFGAETAEHIRKERELDLFEDDTELYRVNLQFFIAYT